MTQFIYKNKYKIALIAFLCFLLIALSSCRPDTNTWYNKPYVDGWAGFNPEFQLSEFL